MLLARPGTDSTCRLDARAPTLLGMVRELVAWAGLVVVTTVGGLGACGDRDGAPQGSATAVAVDGDLRVLEQQAGAYVAEAHEPALEVSFTHAQYEVVRALCMLDWRTRAVLRRSDAGTRIGVTTTIRVLPIPAPTRTLLAAVASREWSFESFALRDRVLSEVTTTPESHARLRKFSQFACAPLFRRWDACLSDPACPLVPDTERSPADPVPPRGDFRPGDAEHADLLLDARDRQGRPADRG